MTPLEAAQDIMSHGPPMIEDAWCGVCQRVIHPLPGIDAGPHADSCPWLMMPQIIAALEAYEKVTA